MARVDDYNQAFDLGKKQLIDKDIQLLAQYAGAKIQHNESEDTILVFDFFHQPISVSWPDLSFMYMDTHEEVPVQERVLLVHYLNGAWSSQGAPLTGKWIAYQEVPDGRFYLDAFQKRAKIPLLQGFGQNPEWLTELSEKVYGATPSDHGDISVEIQVLPLMNIALILWKGDDEFPPEGNILFDQNISRIFSAEDIAWLAGMTVYPLVGMARSKGLAKK